jgi:Outer membrane protein beta-barrel domain
MRNICAFIVLLCLTYVCAAQSNSNDNFEEVKIYGGYQYTRLDTHAVQDALNLQHALDPTFPLLNFGSHQSLYGWNFGGEEDTLAKWFGVVVDVSGTYGTNNVNLGSVAGISTKLRTKLRFYTFTGGPQFTLRSSSKVQPFARALIGGAWESFSANVLENNVPQFAEVKASDSGFAYGGGGGVDFFFSSKIGLRVAADLIRTPFFNDTQNNLRGTAALVFRFGK